MDKQENGEIEAIMLEEYLDNLDTGEKVVITKLDNGNLDVSEYDDVIKENKRLQELVKKINRLIEYNSYDECGEFKDNDIWNMKLD